jgi:hypothetical protein
MSNQNAVQLTLYERLGIGRNANFAELKKAYYSRAKECHPDRFKGDPLKETEFKQLVNAFEVLSDPVKRQIYDDTVYDQERLHNSHYEIINDTSASIMDDKSDDILEELIVGNQIFRIDSLYSLFEDLQNTEHFILFREAKTAYFNNADRIALRLFRKCVDHSPHNILAHYYLARSAIRTRKYALAEKHYDTCLRIGLLRTPVQHLHHIKQQLHKLRKQNRGLIGKLKALLKPFRENRIADAEGDMINEVNSSISKIMRQKNLQRTRSSPRLIDNETETDTTND